MIGDYLAFGMGWVGGAIKQDEMWDKYRTGMGQVWDKYRTGTGQVQDRYRTSTGQVWDKYGAGTGQIWDRYGTSTGQIQDKYRTGMGQVCDKFMTISWYNIIISHASEEDKMFTLHDHEPACAILTPFDF